MGVDFGAKCEVFCNISSVLCLSEMKATSLPKPAVPNGRLPERVERPTVHRDSSTVAVSGKYEAAPGRRRRDHFAPQV